MTEKKKISLLIADDHQLVRRGFIHILSLFQEFIVLAEVSNGLEAVAKAEECVPDVIIMDLDMPEMNGIEATRKIKKSLPITKILIVSAYSDEGYVYQVFRNGANGYLLKTYSPEDFRSAIHYVLSNSKFYCPHIDHHELSRILHPELSSDQNLIDALTSREREILQLIAKAKSHKEIAHLLHISIRTVDTHRNNILQKLSLHDSVSLVTFALKNGIVVLSK